MNVRSASAATATRPRATAAARSGCRWTRGLSRAPVTRRGSRSSPGIWPRSCSTARSSRSSGTEAGSPSETRSCEPLRARPHAAGLRVSGVRPGSDGSDGVAGALALVPRPHVQQADQGRDRRAPTREGRGVSVPESQGRGSLTEASGRKRVYIVEHTITERYYYDPEEIRQTWGDALDAWEGSFEDFVIDLFEQHDGSVFHGKFFYNDANPSVGVELLE